MLCNWHFEFLLTDRWCLFFFSKITDVVCDVLQLSGDDRSGLLVEFLVIPAGIGVGQSDSQVIVMTHEDGVESLDANLRGEKNNESDDDEDGWYRNLGRLCFYLNITPSVS